MTRFITILTPREMADELNISLQTLNRSLNKNSKYYDKDFPVIELDRNLRRFIKELVVPYYEGKKKFDCVKTLSDYKSLILRVDLKREFLV